MDDCFRAPKLVNISSSYCTADNVQYQIKGFVKTAINLFLIGSK